jgi:tetratricopeptide (TPR) repeat protein
LRAVGESDLALDVLGDAATSAKTNRQIVRAQIALARTARQASCYEHALESLNIAQKAAEELGSDEDLAQIHYLRGNLFFPLGRIDDMLASTERALTYAEKTHSILVQVGGYSNFGDASYMKGAMITADGYYSRAIDLARAHGLSRDLAANLHNRGAARTYLGQNSFAIADAEESLSLARKSFAPVAACVALAVLCIARFVEGDMDEALDLGREGIRLAGEVGAQRFEAQARGYTTRILALENRLDEARAMGECGVGLALSAARNFSSPKELSALALASADPDEQERLLSQGGEILAEGCVSHCHFFFYGDAIRIMLARRDWDRAMHYSGCLEEYTRSEPLPLVDLTVRQARLLAEIGRNSTSNELEEDIDTLRKQFADFGLKQTFAGLYDQLPV